MTSCNDCDKAGEKPEFVAPYRIGNKDIGYGIIAFIGCRKHIKLAIDRLNSIEDDDTFSDIEDKRNV